MTTQGGRGVEVGGGRAWAAGRGPKQGGINGRGDKQGDRRERGRGCQVVQGGNKWEREKDWRNPRLSWSSLCSTWDRFPPLSCMSHRCLLLSSPCHRPFAACSHLSLSLSLNSHQHRNWLQLAFPTWSPTERKWKIYHPVSFTFMTKVRKRWELLELHLHRGQ